MQLKIHQSHLALLFLAISAAILFSLGIGSGLGFMDGDSITHYIIAGKALYHPILFLHHWGKPFFILVSAPFAFFGFGAMQAFNIGCGLAASWVAFLTGKKLGLRYAAYIIPLTLFSPMYSLVLPTGLTEPLFSLVLVLGVYFFLDKKEWLFALLFSVLPFVRNEAYVFLPVLLLCLILSRKLYWAPLLAAGFIVYSVIGYFVFKDIGWLIHQNPYDAVSSYGHGPWYFFIQHSASTTGIALAISFCAGLAYVIYKIVFPSENETRESWSIELLLVFGMAIVFVAAHSYVWYKGIFGSAGMLRVVAGVIPLVALGAMRGAEGVFFLVRLRPVYAHVFLLSATCAIYLYTFQPRYYGQGMDANIVAIKKAAEYVDEMHVPLKRIFISHPAATVFLDIDPFEERKPAELANLANKKFPGRELDSGSIIVWDSFFGPSTDVPLQAFDTPEFKILRRFPADNGAKPGDGNYFEAVVLERK